MPQIELKTSYSFGPVGTLMLYAPLPGRTLYEVRKALEKQGNVTVIWQGELDAVREYQAIHWVDIQRTVAGGGALGWRNYQVSQASGFEGYDTAVESLYSAVVAMLEKGAEIGGAKVLVARKFGR
ncbi:hypothetical protein Q5H92_22930 [Hymenobacter sp. M29]|uniref:Uncharacterized protein n=1 Tax=Hymenobacter mellowenesis TaxID=3063995 RepID=A0ABT9AH96_9BACT|nr:hypothetical protein [Hymenobacter sp. M29]MDO7849237.1 hypothetical protein [Hymenobacter sp. M29]